MSSRNMTDIIEAYLKEFLKHQEHVEIKRSDIAEHFDCVPSQINYVIKTRKIELADEAALIDQLIELVGDKISQRNGIHMIENLIGKGLITNREGTLILSVIEKSVLHQISEQEQAARAQLLKTFLQQLKYSY